MPISSKQKKGAYTYCCGMNGYNPKTNSSLNPLNQVSYQVSLPKVHNER